MKEKEAEVAELRLPLAALRQKQQTEARKAKYSGSATARAPLTGELRVPCRCRLCEHVHVRSFVIPLYDLCISMKTRL